MVGFKVINRTAEKVWCLISRDGRTTEWWELAPNGGEDNWGRNRWEDVQFRNQDSTRKKSLWVNRGDPAIIYFDGFDEDLQIENDYSPPGGITVHNGMDMTIFVSVTKNPGGSTGWYEVTKGSKDQFDRESDTWETVAVKSEDDRQRKGVYVNSGTGRCVVTFKGFDKDFVVENVASNTIKDEHFAEAVAIADRSHYGQSSRASTEGGLKVSVEKCDIVSLYSVGRTMDLDNHIQIYTLAMLINHLKYGLVGAAMVVDVTPEWVKVACHTDEFDGIVVMGFPKEAIELVAPHKQMPSIGTKLIAISQFTQRTPEMGTGVLGDITIGPLGRAYWYNFHPLVAQFLTDDSSADVWQKHIDEATNDHEHGDIWERIWDYWLNWKEKNGSNYFRLGTPSKIKEISTHHDAGPAPPSYTP